LILRRQKSSIALPTNLRYNNEDQNAATYFFVINAGIGLSKPAYSIPTKWEDTGTNMSDLLNSGWKLTAHGVTRVAANGNGISSGFSEIIYTFTLTNSPDRFMV
jgi:hypothetical protein